MKESTKSQELAEETTVQKRSNINEMIEFFDCMDQKSKSKPPEIAPRLRINQSIQTEDTLIRSAIIVTLQKPWAFQ